MPAGPAFDIRPIGRVESPPTDPESAPKQGDEGAPDAWLVFEPEVVAALDGIQEGDDVLVLTWLDRASRDILLVHPRGDESRPQQGVFNTRSPHRPNPIGLHRVEVASMEGARVLVPSSRRWTVPRSSTSSRCSAATSASAERWDDAGEAVPARARG